MPSFCAHHQRETAMSLYYAHGGHVGYFPGHYIDSNVSQAHYSSQIPMGGSWDPCLVTVSHTGKENKYQSNIPSHRFDDHSIANRQ